MCSYDPPLRDLTMVPALYAQIQSRDSLAGLPVYFYMDGLLMVYRPPQAMYQCEISDDWKVRVVRLEISL